MGFGILFLGYLVLMNFVTESLTGWVAYILILYALLSLSQYNRGFTLAKYAALVCSIVALPDFILSALDMMHIIVLDDIPWLSAVIYYPLFAAKTVLQGAMLYGIYEIGKETEDEKIYQKAAYRGFLFLLLTLFELALGVFGMDGYVWAMFIIFRLLVSLLILLLIFRCYRYITVEGENEGYRESRFKFVNDFRRVLDEKEQLGIERTKEDIEARRKRKAEKTARKGKRK